jgi:DNA-binding NtrC family response regulator
MQRGRILVVEDDDTLCRLTQVHLRKCGYTTAATATAAEALRTLDNDPQDLVISDLHLPGMSGLELLKTIKAKHPEIEVVMLTAFATVPTAVEAMKSGASDYLSKPIHLYELSAVVDRLLERTRLVEEVQLLRHSIDEKYGFQNVIGRSKSLLYVLEQAARVAPTDATVLIQGETGTGKEVLAKTIHFNSPRRERPLVTINCAAIPRDLLESELFGHVRGSFTGAIAHKMGKVERANGGTLFLDEIGELALDLQVRLLRLIQEREIEKIGGTAPTKVDIRVIAATNRDLGALAANGTFREDLYYRLAVVPIAMPPLRNRAEDIPNFVDYFFEVSRQKHGKPKLTLPSSLIAYFIAYRWPGNVRELENTIERIVVLSNGSRVTIDDLPETLQPPRQTRPKTVGCEEGVSLQAVERELIFQALRQLQWNQSRAAKSLGITRKTLMYRIAKYGIKREEGILDPSKDVLSSAAAGHH